MDIKEIIDNIIKRRITNILKKLSFSLYQNFRSLVVLMLVSHFNVYLVRIPK